MHELAFPHKKTPDDNWLAFKPAPGQDTLTQLERLQQDSCAGHRRVCPRAVGLVEKAFQLLPDSRPRASDMAKRPHVLGAPNASQRAEAGAPRHPADAPTHEVRKAEASVAAAPEADLTASRQAGLTAAETGIREAGELQPGLTGPGALPPFAAGASIKRLRQNEKTPNAIAAGAAPGRCMCKYNCGNRGKSHKYQAEVRRRRRVTHGEAGDTVPRASMFPCQNTPMPGSRFCEHCACLDCRVQLAFKGLRCRHCSRLFEASPEPGSVWHYIQKFEGSLQRMIPADIQAHVQFC